jgi:SAM-dependent methyltransferase
MKEFYVRNTCRLCGSNELNLVLPLHESSLCDAYIKEKKEQNFYSLDLFLCNNCGFVQINTIIDPEIIYKDYIYVTTSSSGLQNHFKAYADEVCSQLQLIQSNLTVDIGSNDGTLLSFFKDKRHRVLGIEPSLNTAHEATINGIETLPNFFDNTLAEKIINQYGHADLITINNLFANIDNLEEFTKGVERLLAKDGVLVIESSYLIDMIDNMVFDFIYHEHLSYFSILPLVKFFKKFKMRLIRLQEVSTKGGSLRYYWAKENSKWDVDSIVEQLSKREQQANINMKTFEIFQSRIDFAKEQMFSFLQSIGRKKIVGYGASATSTTLISHFQLNQYISYLVDDNPGKIGTYSPGYHIPVYSSTKLQDEIPDVVIILAWRFKDEILKKLPGIASKVIVPLPHFEILKS